MDLYNKVNFILADWNPIGVDSAIALDEYKGYIPLIIRNLNNRKNLLNALITILSELGLDYDSENISHQQELDEIIKNLLKIDLHT